MPQGLPQSPISYRKRDQMKVDVITVHVIKNYGSVFQALAIKEKFPQHGWESEFINYIWQDAVEKIFYNGYTQYDLFLNNTAKSTILYPTFRRWQHGFGGFLKRSAALTPKIYTTEAWLGTDVPRANQQRLQKVIEVRSDPKVRLRERLVASIACMGRGPFTAFCLFTRELEKMQ
jgi:hypothetical protein